MVLGTPVTSFADLQGYAGHSLNTYVLDGLEESYNVEVDCFAVSRWWVATAGHCVVRAALSQITVFLGELDTQNTGQVNEPAPAEKHHVTRKIIHPQFQLSDTQPDR